MPQNKKVGLALGSGGVRGLAHIGVLKILIKHNIPIDFMAGCSIGSWVGAHYARYQDIQKLEEFTVGKKKEKLLSFLEPSFTGGLVKGDKFEKLIDGWLEGASFEDLKIPLAIVATDLLKGEPVIFTSGQLAPAIRASVAIPGVFKAVNFEDKILIDGGACDPVPDNVVKKMGADIVIAVNLDNFQESDNQAKAGYNLSKILIRTTEVMRHYLAAYSLDDADIIIQPKLAQYSSWREYFINNEMGKKVIALGEEETKKVIPELKKLLK